MKNSKEMADKVFEMRDTYYKKRGNKILFLKIALGSLLVMAFLIAVFYAIMNKGYIYKKTDKIKVSSSLDNSFISVIERGKEYNSFELLEKQEFRIDGYEGKTDRYYILDNHIYFTAFADGEVPDAGMRLYETSINAGMASEVSLPEENKEINIISIMENNKSVWAAVKISERGYKKEEYGFWKLEKNIASEIISLPDEMFKEYKQSVIDDEGGLYVLNEDGSIFVYKDGEINSIENDDNVFKGIARSREGRIFALLSNNKENGEFIVSEINTVKFTKEGKTVLSDISKVTEMMNGSGRYDFYINDGSSIYGYNLLDSYAYKTVDISGLPGNPSFGAALPDEDTLIFTEADERNGLQIRKCVRIPADTIKGKGEIRMAVFNGVAKHMPLSETDFMGIADLVKSFNEENEEWYITITDYSDYWPNETAQLGLDLADGKSYDIYVLPGGSISGHEGLSYYGFLAKDAFEDLSSFYEKSGIDFLPEVLDGIETDGKKYLIPSGFYLPTAYGKKDVLNGMKSNDISEYMDLFRKNENAPAVWPNSPENLFCFLAVNYIYEHIDLQSGKNSIDGKLLAEMLEFSTEYGKKEATGDGMTNNALIEGEYGFGALRTVDDMSFFSNRSFCGYPSDEGSGIHMSLNNCLALSKTSSKKEGAYQFFTYVLREENYKKWSYYGLPILKSLYEKQVKEYPSEYAELLEKTRNECDGIRILDLVMENVVYEELNGFLAGEVSAEECAKHMIERLSIFVSERN